MSKQPCIFCQIIHNEVNAIIVYQDDRVTAFRDIHPVSPTHILITPNKHIESLNMLAAGDEVLIQNLFSVARELALQEKIVGSGFRLVLNTGPDGGQSVAHLHLHLIGGRRMHWPPG